MKSDAIWHRCPFRVYALRHVCQAKRPRLRLQKNYINQQVNCTTDRRIHEARSRKRRPNSATSANALRHDPRARQTADAMSSAFADSSQAGVRKACFCRLRVGRIRFDRRVSRRTIREATGRTRGTTQGDGIRDRNRNSRGIIRRIFNGFPPWRNDGWWRSGGRRADHHSREKGGIHEPKPGTCAGDGDP